MATELGIHNDAVRASDQERERVVSLLREHAGSGRLDVDELAERLGRAYGAVTRGDLASLTQDLPPTPPVADEGSRRERRELASHMTVYVAVNLLLIGIWALTGAGYFWPVWPILGWGIGIASHSSETLLGSRFAFPGACGRKRSGHRVTA